MRRGVMRGVAAVAIGSTITNAASYLLASIRKLVGGPGGSDVAEP